METKRTETQTEAPTEAPTEVTYRPFRYRMRDLLRAATWDDGAMITVETIQNVNEDLQNPLLRMRTMMETRGFTIEANPTHWIVTHPVLNHTNWQEQLYNF